MSMGKLPALSRRVCMNEWVVQVGQGQIQHYFVAHVCKNKHNSSFVPMRVQTHHLHYFGFDAIFIKQLVIPSNYFTSGFQLLRLLCLRKHFLSISGNFRLHLILIASMVLRVLLLPQARCWTISCTKEVKNIKLAIKSHPHRTFSIAWI